MGEDIEFGKGITHIEDLKPQQLLKFLKVWGVSKDKIVITEKMDGMFMGFGLEQGKFFLQSKRSKWYSAASVPNIYFLEDMRRYFLLLQDIPLQNILKKYGYQDGDDIRFSGEAIPCYNHNIVIYDEQQVGDGAYIIFQLELGSKRIVDLATLSKVAQDIQSHTSIRFTATPKAHGMHAMSIPNKITLELEGLLEKQGNVLSKPARTPEEKAIKQELLQKIKNIGLDVKSRFLAIPYTSAFGGQYEGFVLQMPDGSLIKFVDKDKFTATKEANWLFLNKYGDALNTFIKQLKTKQVGFQEGIAAFEKELHDIDEEFKKNLSLFTNEKKMRDTVEASKRMKKIAALLKQKVSAGASEEEIVDLMQNKKLDESKQLVSEGGNVFDETNSVVPRKYLESTVQNALEMVGLSNVPYELVGNTSKEYLGDIDVALNVVDVAKAYNITNPDVFWEELKVKTKQFGVPSSVNKGLKQFHYVVPVVDQQGKPQQAVDPQTHEVLDVPGKVQIDFMVGNLSWMKYALSGAKDSKYKAAARNVLLYAITLHIPTRDANSRFVFDRRAGLRYVTYDDVTSKKKKAIQSETVATSADDVAHMLFGLAWKDIDTFEKAWTAFTSPSFRFKAQRKAIVNDLKRFLLQDKLQVPAEIEAFHESVLREQVEGKRIAVFPGSFKPFHLGHWTLMKMAADISDEVYVFASNHGRDSMSGTKATEYINRFIIPALKTVGKKVSIKFTPNPVGAVYETLGKADEDPNNHNTYILIAGEEDLKGRFSQKSLAKVAPRLYAEEKITSMATPRLFSASGTKVREALTKDDFETFKKNLPPPVQNRAQEAWDYLKSEE